MLWWGYCWYKAGRHRHSALAAGPAKVQGAEVAVTTIRGGFGLAVAAALATGKSPLSGTCYLDRDRVVGEFTDLGTE